MQKGHKLQFNCTSCEGVVRFSLFDSQGSNGSIHCSECNKHYLFEDPTLLRQLKKFEALCRQLQESEEILGSAHVGIDIGEHHVKVPYKLLLTRLNSSLDLMIGDKPISIIFRLEPTQDLKEFVTQSGR